MAELLLGLLYNSFPEYQEKIENLPISNVPREIREKNLNFKYLGSHRLNFRNNHITIGDHMVALSQTVPYKGWPSFRSRVDALIEAVKKTGLVQAVERYSLKVINMFTVGEGHQLELLNGKFEVAGIPAAEQGFRFKTEFTKDGLVTILEIDSRTSTSLPGGEMRSGLMIQLDAIRESGNEAIWQNYGAHLDQLHHNLEVLFFSVLTDSAVQDLGPIWAD